MLYIKFQIKIRSLYNLSNLNESVLNLIYLNIYLNIH